MEGQVKFFSPQNTALVSQAKDIVVTIQTIVANGDQDSNVKKTNKKT